MSISCCPPGDLVVRGVDRDAHAHQRADHALAQIAIPVAREVEVGAAVVAGGHQRPVGHPLEQEELHLGADAILEAEPFGLPDRSTQHPTGVALVGLAVRRRCPADEPGGALVGPRQDLKRRGVGDQVHVRFRRACRGVHRRAVEPRPVRDGLAQLGGGYGDRLHAADDVGELEIDVAYLRRLNFRQEVGGRFPMGGRWQLMASN